uniref:Importin 4 n=1 Tax=Mastacembelus armatus TaxID=205130 RepID=A0A7N9B1U3_9TELE
MTEELEQILLQLTQPDNAVIQQATAQLKETFKDPAIIPALCTVMSNSQNPQIRQSAAVMLRLRVKKHWKKISPNDRECLKAVVLQAFMQETEHAVQHSISQLCAVLVKHETPDRWPALLQLLNQSTKSSNPHDRQVGLLLLNKVIDSNPEPFKPHYGQLLQLLSTVLQDHNNPTALYYCILTLTAITAYIGSKEMVRLFCWLPFESIIPFKLLGLSVSAQDKASEAMEVLNELMESEVSIIVPHVADIVRFCIEVGALSLKSFSSSQVVLKQKLVNPILQAIFPILTAAPSPGEQDPEDEEDDSGDGTDDDNPKHCAAQVMPFIQACLASENPYQRKGGLMSLAVLAEGCADHMRTNMLSSVLQTVCQSLSDSNQVVRSAALFALGQFSQHLQPDVSKYCSELMPLLLGYLSSLNQAKVGHVTKAVYALENFIENIGSDIEPYLPTLMDTMLSALNSTENLKIKELAVSAIGAIANAAKTLLVPYFTQVIESLKDFLTTTTDEMRSVQTQSLDTLSVLARTIGEDVFSPLAAECVQLGLNLIETCDDPDLRRCTYSLYSAVSTVSPDCLTPHLTAITTVMLLALKSNEGIMAHFEDDKTFVLLDDDDDEEDKDIDDVLEDETEADVHDIAGFSVENAYIAEKEDACDALGEISLDCFATCGPINLGPCSCLFYLTLPILSAFGAMGQFCRAQHKVWTENPTEVNHQALQKLLDVVIPCFVEAVRTENERQVVMGILETMNSVIKSCKEEVFRNPSRLKEISHVISDVLKKKTACQDGGGYESDDEEQQAEYDAMLQEFAGEGIPLLASSVPADIFAPFLNDLLPLIMSKAKFSCTVADRSFSVGTIGEILQALGSVSGGQRVAGRLSNRLLPVLVAGVKDSDPEVRNNSVFGLGCLAEVAGSIVVSYPSYFFLSLSSDLRVIDNLCAALCRMIMSNVGAVPLEQVVPALVAHLPLKQDLEENKTVSSCLAMLYKHNPALVQYTLSPTNNIPSVEGGCDKFLFL